MRVIVEVPGVYDAAVSCHTEIKVSVHDTLSSYKVYFSNEIQTWPVQMLYENHIYY